MRKFDIENLIFYRQQTCDIMLRFQNCEEHEMTFSLSSANEAW